MFKLWWFYATRHHPIVNLRSRRQSSRVWRKHFHLCRLWMATSDWPQTRATTSARTSLRQVCSRASETAATAQSRKSLRLKKKNINIIATILLDGCVKWPSIFNQIRAGSQQAEKVRSQAWHLPSAAEPKDLWQLFPHRLCSGSLKVSVVAVEF